MSGLRGGRNIGKLLNDKWVDIKDLWHEGWVKIPEIMGGHVLSTIGLIGFGIISYAYRNHTFIPRTFNEPLILRPDDPRAKKTLTYYEEGWDEKYGK